MREITKTINHIIQELEFTDRSMRLVGRTKGITKEQYDNIRPSYYLKCKQLYDEGFKHVAEIYWKRMEEW